VEGNEPSLPVIAPVPLRPAWSAITIGNGNARYDPLVSIVILATTREPTFSSDRKRSFSGLPRIELMVFDDGSTDGRPNRSGRLRRKVSTTRPRKHGPSQDLEQRLGHVQGPFLSYLAADDFLLPGAVGRRREPHRGPQDRSHFTVTSMSRPESHVCGRFVPRISVYRVCRKHSRQPGPGSSFARRVRARGLWMGSSSRSQIRVLAATRLEGAFLRIPKSSPHTVHDRSQSSPRRRERGGRDRQRHFRALPQYAPATESLGQDRRR